MKELWQFSKNNINEGRCPEVRRRTVEMVPCCSHTVGNYFSLYVKSQALKLTKKMHFFIIFMNVTICDLHGHRRSLVMV